MEWRALEEHFRVAATQEPGPFGDDAIEWDYSRYARALGLVGEPGAHDLPHRGCAVLALPEVRWDAAGKKYGAWAEERGWTLWRFSARPTVAVPDPVVYALGVRAAGPDSLLFARAAQPARPAMGGRPRSEGMSFPLTPGERWLMASDRVRRRMRVEIAMRGLVLFVEEAEWLTPAGLGVLMYLLDAHRAWRARMLSRPARVYVVLVTAPEREGAVMRMLERFQLAGHTPVARERRKDDKRATGFVPPALRDIEEEYLFGALSAAPVALAEDDVRAVFGSSAIERCRALVDRGLLRLRTEAGQTCYLPTPVPPAEPVHAPLRALVALAARYRQRARRGHEHLALASAGLSLALGCPLRAAAAVARMPHTAGALLPLRLFEEIDAALERARPRLRADHMSAWFSLAAHQRAYDHARDLAAGTTDRELRTWKEMHRLVRVVFCTGRAHLDLCLPPDFWPKLKSVALAGPFMDATCVLGELFWRKNHLGTADVRQRYVFAVDCLERASHTFPKNGHFKHLERIARLIIYRAAVHLGTQSTVLTSHGAPVGPRLLRAYLRANQLPAYIASTLMYAEATAWQPTANRSFDHSDRPSAGALAATAGQPAELAVGTATTITALGSRGATLLLRDVVDELSMLLLRRTPPGERHCLARFFQCAAGGRVWLMGANALYLEHGRGEVAGRDAFDDIVVTDALLFAGDVAGAADRLAVGFARKPSCPFLTTMLIQSHIVLARKAKDISKLAATPELLERTTLPQDLRRYLVASTEGSAALWSSAWDVAGRQFWAAHGSLAASFAWTAALKTAAARSARRVRYVGNTVKSWTTGARGGPSVWTFMRTVCQERDEKTSSPLLGRRVAVNLEFILPALEVWARGGREADEILQVAFFLKGPVDAVFQPLGRDFLGLVAESAPSFYECLRGAVIDKGGDLGVAAPEVRAVNAALRTIEEAWTNGHQRSVDERCTRIVIRSRGSRMKQAREAGRYWYDDATTYAQLWGSEGEIRWRGDADPEVVAYGYVGRVRAKPVATTLKVRMCKRDGDAVEVVVDAGASSSRIGSGRRRPAGPGEAADAFLGTSAAAKRVRATIETAARCSYPTLLLGETGVGKDLVAKCIHATSSRRTSAMVIAECAATAEGLLESEFFGHEKGAFTGAHASHEGIFERADASALLLDEVDSMPSRLQAVLLRVLETGEYRPVGAASTRKSDFRLISAALPRLLTMVNAGQFRKDLFYRISALTIEIPPLRDRDADSQEIAIAHARSLGLRLTGGALRAIEAYDWPGNIRQLRHGIQAASLHAHDGRIGEATIADVIGGYRGAAENGRAQDPCAIDAAWGRALRSLERMGRFGALDFAQAAELSRRSAQRHIVRLLREGTIIRVGAGRATRYRVGVSRRS